MVLKTKLRTTRKGSASLRTTVPEAIVVTLNLRDGDDVEWKIEIKGNQPYAILTKAKPNI